MRILIVGAGVVGSTLAEDLSSQGHIVSIVDRNAQWVDKLNDRLDVLAVAGNGCSPSVLIRAGIEEAEMLLAVTSIDEVNVVICMLAARFGVKHKIARLRQAEYVQDGGLLRPAELGIDTVITPEDILTAELLNILKIPGSTEVAAFADGRVLMVTFDIHADSPIAGKRLRDLRDAALMASFLVVAILRDERAIIPGGDDRIDAGDHIVIIVHADTVSLLLPMIQPRAKAVQRVVIYGSDLLAQKVARALTGAIDNIVLIEADETSAERVAADLEHVLVLRGDATNPTILREANTANCDFFMALSADDESNLLAALMAKRCGAERVAVMAQNPDYVPVLDSIGMNVVINPRLAAVSAIMRHIRIGRIHMVARLRESEGEVIELEADPGAPITKKPLSKLALPLGSIIAAAIRDGDTVIPDGEFQIREGETVVIFALPAAIPKIGRFFSNDRRNASYRT